ncbi:heme ABC transporter ATP-binding protein [Amphritea sp. HPY]|uniref:heme ABC transporter ATP-binding protein n=1 Tax=Amphritea sp. HPY TaxID=3421652 RepID=UPI003D7C5FDC
MLSADKLSLNAGAAQLLQDIDLQLAAGEMMVVLGPNGAGKSSLLSLLSGLRAPDSGSVTLERKPLSELEPELRARKLAMYTQQQPLNFPFTVEQVIALGCYPLALSVGQAREQVRLCLQQLELEAFAAREYTSLSGGERQRVQLARVLAQVGPQCQLLLLDEPVSEMDLKHQQMVMGLLRQLAGRGVAVICVLHDLNLAAQYAGQVTLLQQGRLVASGPRAEVMTEARLSELYQLPVRCIENDYYPVFVSG